MSENQMPWVDGWTIGGVLHETAIRHADQMALVFPQAGYRATYAQFEQQVNALAKGLLAMGLAKGDHLALWCTNWPQWVRLQFATARIGVVLVNVNPAYRAHELEYVLRQSDARVLALIEQYKTSHYFELLASVLPESDQFEPGMLASPAFPRLRRLISLSPNKRRGMLTLDEVIQLGGVLDDGLLVERQRQLSASDAINIQYTSGTTGFPKGVMLSHRNLLLNAYYIGDCLGLGEQDRICIPVPFYHCFGCVLGTLCAVVHGAGMVIPNEAFDAGRTLDAVETERCTAIYGVPTMFIAELEHESYSRRDLTSLRTGIMAGSPCPIELMKRVTSEMGARDLTIAYGLTEASPVITQTRTNETPEVRVRTVGRPIPGVEVGIFSPGSDVPLAAGQVGELRCRGHGVMLGYYNMPDATAEAIDAAGWLHTGDLALMEPSGYYRITGRLKDMVIRGGENIYPREIEEFLYTHPAVQDVQVVGVPDRKYGEELLAWIKLRPGQSAAEDEIRRFCRDRLAHFKVPRYVQFVESFPMTVTGKIQKYKIREQAIRELGLGDIARVETA